MLDPLDFLNITDLKTIDFTTRLAGTVQLFNGASMLTHRSMFYFYAQR